MRYSQTETSNHESGRVPTNTSPKRLRFMRRFRFDLRTLMLLFSGFIVALGIWSSRAARQRELAAWVIASGGTPYYMNSSPMDELDSIFPTSWLRVLGVDYFHSIRRLHFEGKPVADYSRMSRLHTVQCAEFVSCDLQDFRDVSQLRNLRMLSIRENPLQSLDGIQQMRRLGGLVANNTRIDDLEPLRGHPTLSLLCLRNTPISDLGPLADVANLRSLDLAHTNISDIAPLKSLSFLWTLNISGTNIGDEQIESLQAVLPNCEITR